MFCFQCEQTEGAKGCRTVGVCGKTPQVWAASLTRRAAAAGPATPPSFSPTSLLAQVAHLQDATMHALKSLSAVAHAARTAGMKPDVDVRPARAPTIVRSPPHSLHGRPRCAPAVPQADRTLLHVMFATLTNVNFDAAYFVREIPHVLALRDSLLAKYRAHCAATGRKAEVPPLADWNPPSNSEADLEAAGVAVGVIERRAVIGEEAIGLSELITYGLKVRSRRRCVRAATVARWPS